MDKRELEIILSDQKEEIEAKKKLHFCRRAEEDLIDLDSSLAQVVIGVRRCGKSTLCFNALTRKGINFAFVNFDDERLVKLTGEDLNDVLEVLYKIYGTFEYLFIDEIQNIAEWFLFVNRLLRRGIRVVVTGSNAKLLSGELATHLTGRYNAIELYPFSFEEFCWAKDVAVDSVSTKNIAHLRAAFDEYLKEGGFPELQFIRNKRDYINLLVNNILSRDIVQRFRIKHIATFGRLAHHLLNIAPSKVAVSKLQELFGLKSQHTVYNYINYLKQAYLLKGIHKYSSKSYQRLTAEKLYPIDVALMNQREDAFAGENLGWRLEVVVFLWLARKCRSEGWDLYYYEERSSECDFLVCEGNKVLQAIQVSYDISNPKTKRRELAGLINVAEKTNCANLLLLTDHEYADEQYKNRHIKIRPVYDYVLGS